MSESGYIASDQHGIAGKQVDYRFCFLYVIGSIAVVCGHLGKGINLFFDWFPPYSFHLPLFLFCSGYFYKKTSSEHVGKYTLHKIKTLLVPLYLWNFVYAVIVLLTHRLGFTIGEAVNVRNLLWGPFYHGHQFGYNCPSWFVAPLFLVQIFNVLFRKAIKRFGLKENEYIITAVYFVLAYFSYGFLQNSFLGELDLPLSHMFTMLPYYAAGVLYKDRLEKKIQELKIGNILYFGLIFLGVLLLRSITGRWLKYNIVLAPIERNSNYYLSYVQTFLGLAFWIRVSQILKPLIQGNRLIKRISDSSFSIMVHQLSAAMLVKTVFAALHRYTPFCRSFRMDKYLSDVYYVFIPGGIKQWLIVYDIAAILIPVFIQYLIDKGKAKIHMTRFSP